MISNLIPRIWRGVAAIGALSLFLFTAVQGHAQEVIFTSQDAVRQAAFLKEMTVAVNAARCNDRTRAQGALRRALQRGAYRFHIGIYFGGESESAFDLPLWLLTAQAAIGDVAGAKETARKLGDPYRTLEAMNVIAQSQAHPAQERADAYIFREAVAKKSAPGSPVKIIFRPHDFSVLKRLYVKTDPAQAAQTLREALPYAETLRLAEAKSGPSPYDFLGPNQYIRALASWQAGIGDAEGVRRTLADLHSPAHRAVVLLYVAYDQRQRKDARAAATEQSAMALIGEMDKGDPWGKAGFYYQRANVRTEEKKNAEAWEALTRCAEALRQVTDLRKRYDGLQSIVYMMSSPGQAGTNDKPAQVAEDKRTKKILLCEMRDLAVQMPDSELTPSTLGPRFTFNPRTPPRLVMLLSIADSLANETGDITEGNATLNIAREQAEQEKNEETRGYLLRLVERSGQIMARRASRLKGI